MVMTGERPAQSIRKIATRNGWGEMYVYSAPRDNFTISGFDNGAYLDWMAGRAFDETKYQVRLDRARLVGVPYIAVVPDLVAQGLRSLDFSWSWFERLRELDWPWYLAVQDGMQLSDVAPIARAFAGLFMGGTDAFKRETADWLGLARDSGIKFHFGRAGTERKIKQALAIGVDSLDSSFPLWTIDRIRRMEYLVNEWQTQEPQFQFN